MNFISEDGWDIRPAGGVTGEAFQATHGKNQLFLKRNSSPFLAVLSAEGIVPKLVWTKRLANGDTITAQQWIQGRKLEPNDMSQERVAKLLSKIHRSKPLLKMLKRLGKTPVFPKALLNELEDSLDPVLREHPVVGETLTRLKNSLHLVQPKSWSVCHGDVHHNNWLLTSDNELFLIDWDNALIADPAIDLGPLLYWYVPKEQWEAWLKHYDIPFDETLKKRLKWYMFYQSLYSIQFFYTNGNEKESQFWFRYLESFF